MIGISEFCPGFPTFRFRVAKKSAHLADETSPGRVARQQHVVAALERNESRPRNAARDQLSLFERYRDIAATMQHQRWRGDARKQVENIEFAERPQQIDRKSVV